ncbi:calmodulin-binding transcription activator [Striga asiatica]|uniref:Calmodulin-binding transcription activator n=1 Tax=Striga asiatica TaxID=4170 RepID=A0A5A7Q3N3_STRAF|nr:calmodulin-binding transcription activator [Striga asiatica]
MDFAPWKSSFVNNGPLFCITDLDFGNMIEEAKTRWLRPNEIHAILCNHKYFTVHVKPMKLPKSGAIVLFDRKKLRNFRKDGHNWKKKKDGKTVKEAHEHLKVGDKERIHVYYAHGEDSPTFVRRCYWLLDKSLENIVLVHYRETQEGSPAGPATPGNSNSSSVASDPSATWRLSEEPNFMVNDSEHNESVNIEAHEQRLHEINTLEWDELLVPDNSNKPITPQEASGQAAGLESANQFFMNGCIITDDPLATDQVSPESSSNSFSGHGASGIYCIDYNISNNVSYQSAPCETNANSENFISGLGELVACSSLKNLGKDGLVSQDSLGMWMPNVNADSSRPVDRQSLEPSISTRNESFTSSVMDNHLSSVPNQIFNITDVLPSWALSTEETKVIVVAFFNGGQLPQTDFSLQLTCGDSVVPVETVQTGVYRCVISPQKPGLVNLYLSFDGHKPVSQVLTFEVRAPEVASRMMTTADNKSNWEEFQLQMRLARLLFSSSKSLSVFSSKVSQNTLKEAKAFVERTTDLSHSWVNFAKVIEGAKMPFLQAKDSLFELTLQNRLQEWLLEKILSGSKIFEHDEQGLGVIHLCAILGYTWAVLPYSCSGLSMDYRDKCGWTALHWAAYYGREKMVAALLSAGAKPNLVTDPTSENPGGHTAADLASKTGHDGLAGYLAEKSLVTQFNEMTIAGNASGTLHSRASDDVISVRDEEEMYLKDTLAAYRTAADAAARIQAAFREHSFKVRKTAAVAACDTEAEARSIVAAMKIQHAFRSYETRKQMAAALRIQYRFRSWKIRRDFLNMRRHAIRIQAAFRGFQVRRQYHKIVWSVGILEKAILRWRLKRKGFRGLQVQPGDVTFKDPNVESDPEEDFFQASRKQAEERVERSVVRVQAMFRSKRAQEDYRRMKLEHNKATLEYEGLFHPDATMS